jgi:hypothetical protein
MAKNLIKGRCRVFGVLVALVSVGLFSSPAIAGATAAKTVTFSGKFSGKASLLIQNSTVTISSISGTGTNSLFGSSKVSGNGSAPKSGSSLCDPFGGKGSIAAGSNKLTFTVTKSSSQQGCSNGESGKVTISFHGVAKATGGGGKGNGASGTLKFSGTLHLGGTSGSQTGNFTVSLNGKLTVKS